ncbi:MAG: lipid II flippase MurJ [Pseudomonadota bacterium]
MYLRAGLFSLGLLLISRVLGLARESVQAAAFGSSGMADVVIVMFTLPDMLVGLFINGALAYVLLPYWAQQNRTEKNASQNRLAGRLIAAGAALGLCIWFLGDPFAHALAPGLQGNMRALAATSLGWSALVLPLAMLAALWTTRLQHERDFVGMYAANLVINVVLVSGLLAVTLTGGGGGGGGGGAGVAGLGACLLLAMLLRLGWLRWRLPASHSAKSFAAAPPLPGASLWIWASLSSGLLLFLPVVGRSIASQGGEGALASFNYAWKLVELPIVLAIQLVAGLAFPAIARSVPDTSERKKAVSLAFSMAWALSCAAVAIVATFSLPLAGLLFGWGRMAGDHLEIIARWGALGIWSLLPQALAAVLLTVMATSRRMHVAVWAYLVALAVLLLCGLPGSLGMLMALSGMDEGAVVMVLLGLVLAGVAVVLMVAERGTVSAAFPWLSCLVPLAVTIALVFLKPLLSGLSIRFTMIACCVYGLLVVGSAIAATPALREMVFARIRPAGPA